MRLGWVAIGNNNVGSTRIGVLNHHNYLINNGYSSYLLHCNDHYNSDILCEESYIINKIKQERITHVCFQKVLGKRTINVIEYCKKNNIKTIYATGDWYNTPIYNIVDWVIVGSDYTKEMIKKLFKINNISSSEDAIEYIPNNIKVAKNIVPTLGWFGNYSKLEYVTNYINQLNINLKLYTISNTPKDFKIKADFVMGAGTPVLWETSVLYDKLFENVDIIVFPIDITKKDEAFAKTANRLTYSMVTGIPVICTPIPCYQKIIKNTVNGFLVNTKEEWLTSINYLKDIEHRNKIGHASINYIKDNFSQKVITEKLWEIFKNI
jgi:glycosyltransferase involved in cell wall biosynthesis